MIEFDNLIQVCYNQFNATQNCVCANNTCPEFCQRNGCLHGDCDKCLNEIMHINSPRFHYPCKHITYYYVLRFFNRFVTEIRRVFQCTNPKSDNFFVVSLGFGPASEVYGFVDGIRSKNPNITIKYRGYDTSTIWTEIQDYTKSIFRGSPHDIDFVRGDMFTQWADTPDCHVNILLLNYLLSDVIKYIHGQDLLQFLDNIVKFIIQHKVSYILFNDIRYYGNDGYLDSGVQCMFYIMDKIQSQVQTLDSVLITHPGDAVTGSKTWRSWNDNSLFYPLTQFNQGVKAWDNCRSKQIFLKITHL